MSTLYLIALGAVTVALLGALIDAVMAVSRPTNWTVRRPLLMVAKTPEHRTQELPVVGRDRRHAFDPGDIGTSGFDRLSA